MSVFTGLLLVLPAIVIDIGRTGGSRSAGECRDCRVDTRAFGDGYRNSANIDQQCRPGAVRGK